MKILPLLLWGMAQAMRSVQQAELSELARRSNFEHRPLAFNETGLALLQRGELPMSLLEDQGPQEDEVQSQLPEVWSNFRVEKKLGGGAFGAVYRMQVKCPHDSGRVSMKLIYTSQKGAYEEVKRLREMQSVDYVVSTVGKPDHVYTRGSTKILMPYLNGGSLGDKLRELKGGTWEDLRSRHPWGPRWSLPFVLALMHQVVTGVQGIHMKGYMHMDIKPDNIMLHHDVNGKMSAYVVDLGISCRPGKCRLSGTPGFISPEAWRGGAITQPHDVFALGVVLYNLVYRQQVPFHRDGRGIYTRSYVPGGRDDAIPPIYKRSKLDELVVRMLSPVAKQRPTTQEVLDSLSKIIGSPMRDMIKSPSERGKPDLPSCLSRWMIRDLGDRKMSEDFCLSESKNTSVWYGCGVTFWKTCCECQVLRNGKEGLGYFQAPECL